MFVGSSTLSGSFLPFLAFLSSFLGNDPKLKSRSGSGSGNAAIIGSSIFSGAFLPPFFISFLPDEAQPVSASGFGSGTTVVAGSSTFSGSFLPFFFSFLPKVSQLASPSGPGSGPTATAGSPTSVIFLPFFPPFLEPIPPHSSATGSTGACTAAAGGGGGGASSSPFLPFFFLVEAVPQAPLESSAAVSGFASAVPMVFGSGLLEISSKAPFFLDFLSIFSGAVKVPQLSLPPTLSSSALSSSFSSSSAPKFPKSNPVVVVFFWFFLFPPNDQALPFAVSVVDSFVVLANESAISVDTVSAPLKLQLLLAPQVLPPPPQPPNELYPPLSFVSVEPKRRSIFGALSSRRLMSAKSLVPLAAGSI